jgi:hypothetical protein
LAEALTRLGRRERYEDRTIIFVLGVYRLMMGRDFNVIIGQFFTTKVLKISQLIETA